MEYCYKVYSVGNNAQPSFSSDPDGCANIFRKIKKYDIIYDCVSNNVKHNHIHNVLYHYALDGKSFNDDDIVIMRKYLYNDRCIDFTLHKQYPLNKFHKCNDKSCSYILLNNDKYGLLSLGTLGQTKRYFLYDINRGYTCNVIQKNYDKDHYDLLKNQYARTIVSYKYAHMHHIYKICKCNVINCVSNPYEYDVGVVARANLTYKVAPANSKQEAFRINVIKAKDEDNEQFKNKLKSFSVNVLQKTDIQINKSVGDISVIVQKNEFFELTMDEPFTVSSLPHGMKHIGNIINGTIQNSGEYNIMITYGGGNTQNINIIVPFYRRLL